MSSMSSTLHPLVRLSQSRLNGFNQIHFRGNDLSSSSLSQKANWAQYREVLRTFVEKGKNLLLPDLNQLPEAVRPTCVKSVQSISPEKILQLKSAQAFGLAEETADVLYYTLLKACLDTGALSKERFQTFQKEITPRLSNPSLENIQWIRERVKTFPTPVEVGCLRSVFPANLPEEKAVALAKAFIEMVLVDYCICIQRGSVEKDLSSPKHLLTKLQEESAEWLEQVALRSKTVRQSLQVSLSNIEQQPPKTTKNYQDLIENLLSVGKTLNPTAKFTFEALMAFALLKSTGRTEYIYLNPDRPYADIKTEAKAWEKLLEAFCVLIEEKGG